VVSAHDELGEEVDEHLSLVSVLANLPELIGSHLCDRNRVAIIVEDEASQGCRYVQFMTIEGHRLVLECVSNQFLAPWCSWDLLDELTLLEMGFAPPAPEELHPNWWWVSDEDTGLLQACRLAAGALEAVLKLSGDASVTLRQRRLERAAIAPA
jgi:hypothetical protein